MPILPVQSQRETFLRLAHAQLKKPYVWGSKGPESFDCSGLVTACFRESGGPDWTKRHYSQSLFDVGPSGAGLQVVREADLLPGDLCFYGRTPQAISHVVICCGPECGRRVLGANGGTSQTTSVARARADGAEVCHRSKPNYRFDLQGYRRLPFTGETK